MNQNQKNVHTHIHTRGTITSLAWEILKGSRGRGKRGNQEINNSFVSWLHKQCRTLQITIVAQTDKKLPTHYHYMCIYVCMCGWRQRESKRDMKRKIQRKINRDWWKTYRETENHPPLPSYVHIWPIASCSFPCLDIKHLLIFLRFYTKYPKSQSASAGQYNSSKSQKVIVIYCKY